MPKNKPNTRYLTPIIMVTPQERDWLYAERRRAMGDYRRLGLSATGHHAGPIEGPRGYLCVAERDKDGSVLASVRVGQSASTARYLRRLRVPKTLGSVETRWIALQRG